MSPKQKASKENISQQEGGEVIEEALVDKGSTEIVPSTNPSPKQNRGSMKNTSAPTTKDSSEEISLTIDNIFADSSSDNDSIKMMSQERTIHKRTRRREITRTRT